MSWYHVLYKFDQWNILLPSIDRNLYFITSHRSRDNELDDERHIEQKVVLNLRNFILQMGKGFCFIGNQYPRDRTLNELGLMSLINRPHKV
jgi:hypothetical protein